MSKSKFSARHLEFTDIGDRQQAALPIYSIEDISKYITTGYWSDAYGLGARSWADKSLTYDISALSPERQALAKMAFAAWDEICGLDFTEASGGEIADISFVMESATGTYQAWETDDAGMGKVITSAQIHLAADFSTVTDVNSYAFETLIHEIGHALGLGHAGNYNGTIGGGAHYQNDTKQFSIMSYLTQNNYGGASSMNVLTPQMADIYAVIKKYGAEDIREGDTTYGFNASGLTDATGHVYDFDNFGFNNFGPALTIVDTGGIDTFDVSGYSNNQRIDLRGGKFSDIDMWKGTIGIYLTSVIENAVGGSGADSITGNKASNRLDGGLGADTLAGLEGKDFLTGGADADTFKYARKGGLDHIVDFEDTIDRIDLRAMDFAKFGKIDKLARDVGDDMVINFGKGDKLVIDDFSTDDFDKRDVLI